MTAFCSMHFCEVLRQDCTGRIIMKQCGLEAVHRNARLHIMPASRLPLNGRRAAMIWSFRCANVHGNDEHTRFAPRGGDRPPTTLKFDICLFVCLAGPGQLCFVTVLCFGGAAISSALGVVNDLICCLVYNHIAGVVQPGQFFAESDHQVGVVREHGVPRFSGGLFGRSARRLFVWKRLVCKGDLLFQHVLGDGQNVFCGVDVPVMACSAAGTGPRSDA